MHPKGNLERHHFDSKAAFWELSPPQLVGSLTKSYANKPELRKETRGTGAGGGRCLPHLLMLAVTPPHPGRAAVPLASLQGCDPS